MHITTKLYKSVAEPPAHVARIHDSGVLLIAGPGSSPHDGGLVLKLEHLDTKHKFNQLFLLSLPQMRQLADALRMFADTWEESHGSQRGDA